MKRKTTTPEQEGIELHPDAWDRFERTVDKVVKSPPHHRESKRSIAPSRRKRLRKRGGET